MRSRQGDDTCHGMADDTPAHDDQTLRADWFRESIMSASNENQSPTLGIAGVASPLMDEPALAAKLGVSRSTLQSWRYAGRGPRFIKLGRMVRYRVADEFLRANTHGQVA